MRNLKQGQRKTNKERMTIPEQLNKIAEEICDSYCKYPDLVKDKFEEKDFRRAFSSEPIEITGEIDEESRKILLNMFETPKEIIAEMVDIYNHMAKVKAGEMVIQFPDGMKLKAVIDSSEWKNTPVVNLEDCLKEGE